MELPSGGGSFTRNKDGKNLKQVKKPTVDHPEGNRARDKDGRDENQLKQQVKTQPSNKDVKE